MTVSTSGYTVGTNQPLHHSRMLWSMAEGATSSTGGGKAHLATNDYTFQRWTATNNPATEEAVWQLTGLATFALDTVFIAAHNLSTIAATFTVETAPELVGPFTWTSRASVTPADNGAIAVMINNAGAAYTVGAFRIRIAAAAATGSPDIGIIRGGEALQMPRPLGTGAEPIGLRTKKNLRQEVSETGEPLIRTVQRRWHSASFNWPRVEASWYRSDFQPFAETLPERPFAFIQNAVSMPESVAWATSDDVVMPEYGEGQKKINISLKLRGYAG